MLDLKRQYRPLHQELLDAVGHVLQTQQFILGEPVAAFEQPRPGKLGRGPCNGLLLWHRCPLAGAGCRRNRPGDALSPPPSASSPRSAQFSAPGQRPCSPILTRPPSTWIRPVRRRKLLRSAGAIRAILPVHLYGQCADGLLFPPGTRAGSSSLKTPPRPGARSGRE
jgi:hypothetical protein